MEENEIQSINLIVSAIIGNLSEVEMRIANGADIHYDDDKALRCSAESGHLEVVKYLVEQGADIHANYDMAVRLAAENGHLDVLKYFAEDEKCYKEPTKENISQKSFKEATKSLAYLRGGIELILFFFIIDF